MTLEELKNECSRLGKKIRHILEESGYDDEEDLCEIEFDTNDPDAYLVRDELERAIQCLAEADLYLQYLAIPPHKPGRITKNEDGLYEVNGIPIDAGETIEILMRANEPVFFVVEIHGANYYLPSGEEEEVMRWAIVHVEGDVRERRYYLAEMPDLEMEGFFARSRGEVWIP